MSKLTYKAMIEDIQNDRCTDAELEALLDTFETTVKRTATTLARKAWFNLADCATARHRGIDRFTLMLERQNVDGQEQWWGSFEGIGKMLKVIGTLEPG